MNTRFQMVRISVPQFAMLAQQMPEEEISLNTEIEYKYNTETPQLMSTVVFRFQSEPTGQPLLILEVACEFSIHPEDWEKLRKKDKIELTQPLMEILAVHTIGTSRGILYCKTEGTPLSNLMIPPLNVRKMIEKND